MFEDFKVSYEITRKRVDELANICYTTEQWRNIVYGTN
jgi:hypothetical protein